MKQTGRRNESARDSELTGSYVEANKQCKYVIEILQFPLENATPTMLAIATSTKNNIDISHLTSMFSDLLYLNYELPSYVYTDSN